jgi:hypothetical protein
MPANAVATGEEVERWTLLVFSPHLYGKCPNSPYPISRAESGRPTAANALRGMIYSMFTRFVSHLLGLCGQALSIHLNKGVAADAQPAVFIAT